MRYLLLLCALLLPLMGGCSADGPEEVDIGEATSGGAGGAVGGAADAGGSPDEGAADTLFQKRGGAFNAGGASGGVPGSGGAASGGAPSAAGGESTGSGGTDPSDSCPYAGHITYQFNGAESWPKEAYELIAEAMEEAVYYYNCYADLTQTLTINYNPSVPTAEANVDGVISFGANESYMQAATAMHELGHTLGVGYYPWTELTSDGRWVGPNVVAFISNLPADQRDPDQYSQRTYITADSQHFWPYGLNQASEYQSEWSLINHVRIVFAMQLDKRAHLEQQ